ncbi:hypothetical protein [Clostridium pasteurianum]|uniref:DUF5659 domain-containing protein n=1 Tax=Clostridium pasteurianum BC1 TaxID=86416 RepID=R4K2G7_CLOPA|nr:hypothetical protein [Clostridium pasteurianum]AGK96773.1 hypothetical protein Clopa_1873 [Clostridium pasteurianum BC1]
MDYVVTSERLKLYLFTLGFTYRQVPDRSGRQKYIWLFSKTDMLFDALTFFSQNKQRMIKIKKLQQNKHST